MSPSLPFIWKKGEKIGQGTFGEVYMGLNQVTGELFGVKQVRIAPGALFGAGGGAPQISHHGDDAVSALETEVAIMKELDHPHIVKYMGQLQVRRAPPLDSANPPELCVRGRQAALGVRAGGPVAAPLLRDARRR
jgi:serine/threonine protein kinase